MFTVVSIFILADFKLYTYLVLNTRCSPSSAFYIGRLYCPCSPDHSAHDSFQPVSIEIGWMDADEMAQNINILISNVFATVRWDCGAVSK